MLVDYRDGVAIKIATRATSLYAAPPDRPVSKLSIDGIRHVLRFARKSGRLDPKSGDHPLCEDHLDLATSRSPKGGEP